MSATARLLCLGLLALSNPALGKPLGSCAISVGDAGSEPCADGACRCLRVSNACPFPVNVVYETGDGQRTVGVGGDEVSTEACADEGSPGRVAFLAWRPAPGYPMAGHPVPMDGVSMTGPVSENP